VDFADECARVWRGRIEQFYPENVIQRNRYGGGSVMICGKIGHYGKTNFIKVNEWKSKFNALSYGSRGS
jgi:hypothetical protein